MGQRVSGCFGHEQRVHGEPVRGERYMLVSDPYAKRLLYSPSHKMETTLWLRTMAEQADERSTASTEVHSSHMNLHPDSRDVHHGHASSTSSSRVVASESPSNLASVEPRVASDWNLADVPLSASVPETSDRDAVGGRVYNTSVGHNTLFPACQQSNTEKCHSWDSRASRKSQDSFTAPPI